MGLKRQFFFSIIFTLILIFGISLSLLLIFRPHFNSIQDLLSPFSPNNTASISGIIKQLAGQMLATTNNQEVFDALNSYRTKANLPLFQNELSLCKAAEKITNNYQTVEQKDLLANCPKCTIIGFIVLSKYASIEDNFTQILAATASSDILNNKNLTHVCVLENDPILISYFAGFKAVKSSTPSKTAPKEVIINNFSEDQLFQALVDYRHAHTRADLQRDENLCVYARKRVNDQISLFQSTKKENYPTPDKYPLDAHDGFRKDAESEEAFKIAGKNELAENLAYWPTAQNANQIIEWGWDSSTEGHREAQLTDYYTHVCLTGKDGFYVAIFGK